MLLVRKQVEELKTMRITHVFKSKIKVAKSVLTVLFYVKNSCINNGSKGKVVFYIPVPLQKSSIDDCLKKVWILPKIKRIPKQTRII